MHTLNTFASFAVHAFLNSVSSAYSVVTSFHPHNNFAPITIVTISNARLIQRLPFLSA